MPKPLSRARKRSVAKNLVGKKPKALGGGANKATKQLYKQMKRKTHPTKKQQKITKQNEGEHYYYQYGTSKHGLARKAVKSMANKKPTGMERRQDKKTEITGEKIIQKKEVKHLKPEPTTFSKRRSQIWHEEVFKLGEEKKALAREVFDNHHGELIKRINNRLREEGYEVQ